MAWIDDRLWCHPKAANLSDAAFRAHVHAIAYSSGFTTRGVLTPGQQRTIGCSPKLRAELVAGGLWDELNDGSICIHDWDEHNGKRDERRKADKLRKQAARDAIKESLASAGQSADESADSPQDVPQDGPQDRRALKVVKAVKEVTESSKAVTTAPRPHDHQFELERLIGCLRNVDAGTLGVLTSIARKLPPSSVAKVRESCSKKRVGAGYAVRALESELAEIEEVA